MQTHTILSGKWNLVLPFVLLATVFVGLSVLNADQIREGMRKAGRNETEPQVAGHASLEMVLRSIRAGGLILDCRTQQEYAKGHTRTAVNAPWPGSEADLASISSTARQAPVVIIYGQDPHSARSGLLRKSLMGAGVQNVYVYLGGWQEWTSLGQEIVP